MARRQGGAAVIGMIRYRPIVQNKEVKMVVDESGDWTSLTCYYTLHDRVVRLQAENDRLRKAGDSVVLCFCAETTEKHKQDCAKAWLAAKEVQS
jgi:hypothetical protein